MKAFPAQRLAAHPTAQFITTQKTGGDCFGGRGRLADFRFVVGILAGNLNRIPTFSR
jgi:hypothetical protein